MRFGLLSSFCPFLFFFFFKIFIYISQKKKKIIYFLWFWLVAEKRGRKDMEINILALGFMLVLQDCDCYKHFTNVCPKGI